MKKHYISAIISLLNEGHDLDVVLSNLATILEQKGHMRLHKAILEGLLTELARQAQIKAPKVTVSREKDMLRFQEHIKEALTALGTTEGPVMSIDPTLVGGFIASYNNNRINASYKEKLVALYRSITT